MRKRILINDLSGVQHASRDLNKNEIEDICQAYRDGCKGEVLIGMRGEERVIVMLLPAQASVDTVKCLMEQNKKRLKDIGCDRYIHIARMDMNKKNSPVTQGIS